MTMRRPDPSLATLFVVTLYASGCPGGNAEPIDPSVSGPSGGAGLGSSAGGGTAGAAAGSAAPPGSGASGGDDGAAGNGGAGDRFGSDAGDGTPFEPIPIADLPAAFAGAICHALRDCLGEAALREITAREVCETRVTAELLATEFHYIDAALDSGHVLYDPRELPACLEGVRDLGCDVLADSFPEPCVQVLAGNVPAGGECLVSAECQGTAFCAGAESGQCPSTCAELLGEGDACSADNECGDQLLCLGGECARLSLQGEACGAQSGRACALGYSCMGSTDTQSGECVENAMVQVGDEDDVCEPGGSLCKDGLSCVFDGASGFHCKPYVAADAACHLGLPGQCPVDQYCDAESVTDEGTCRPLPGAGDACVLTGLCAPGLACVIEGQDPVCRTIRDNGGTCSADEACRSGNCVAGNCAPPLACGVQG